MSESLESLEARLHDLGGFIRDQRRNARLSLRKLSELAGISNPYLSQIERGLRKPSAEILQSIARGLRISAETLYVRAGILEERDTEAGSWHSEATCSRSGSCGRPGAPAMPRPADPHSPSRDRGRGRG